MWGKWTDISRKKRILSVIIVTVAITITLIMFQTFYTSKLSANEKKGILPPVDSNETEIGTPKPGPIDPLVNLSLSGKLRIVSRLEWVAQPPAGPRIPLHLPVPYVIIMDTTTENCTYQADCTFHVRFLQTYHIDSRGWQDIIYNFLVGGDGHAYEGRGWKSEGGHTYGYNARSIGIAIIGTYKSLRPDNRELFAAKQLIKTGVETGYIQEDYRLLCQPQVLRKTSAKKALCDEIETWDHWSPTP